MTINIDYDQFSDMCKNAFCLDANDEYISALWDYFSDIDLDDPRGFFDNLFQMTAWYEDIMDLANDYKDHKEIATAKSDYEKGEITISEFEEIISNTLEHNGICVSIRVSGYLLVF